MVACVILLIIYALSGIFMLDVLSSFKSGLSTFDWEDLVSGATSKFTIFLTIIIPLFNTFCVLAVIKDIEVDNTLRKVVKEHSLIIKYFI